MDIRFLDTDFGNIPVIGYAHKRDVVAFERCAKAHAQKAWAAGDTYLAPLTVEDAMAMPEWQPPAPYITSMGYVQKR